MTVVLKNMLGEKATTEGVGDFTLAGAIAGHLPFTSLTVGSQIYYRIVLDSNPDIWELGLGTYTAANILRRDTVYQGSAGSGVKVAFPAGLKTVVTVLPAEFFDGLASPEPYATAAEDAADRAEAAESAIVAAAAGLQETVSKRTLYRWERLMAAFASGKMPRGVITLSDYGITDWPNPYNVLLFWTGTLIYPLAKIDSNFNYGWIDGDILHVEPNGDMYFSVDIVKMQDPTLQNGVTVTNYHARYEAIGSDPAGVDDTTSGRGATSGNPYKSLNFALTQAKAGPQPFNIFVYGDRVGSNGLSSSASMTISDGKVGKITFVPTRLTRTFHTAMREGMTLAMWNYTNTTGKVYESNSTTPPINDSMKKTPAMVDSLLVDDEGRPRVMRYLGGTWASLAEARAAVAALPGSFAWYGTTGAGLTRIIQTFDGRVPDPITIWEIEGNVNTTWLIGEGSKLYLENFGSFNYVADVPLAGIRARPISVVNTAVRVVHTGQFWLYNCCVVGSHGPAIQYYDIARGGSSKTAISDCGQDAINTHSFYATTAQAGNYMHIFTVRLRAHNIGYMVFGNQTNVGDSNQVVSVHDQAWETRWDIEGGNTRGPVLYDVLGAQSLNINVHVRDPRQAHEPNYTPKTAFACDGALGGPAGSPLSKIRLLHCSGKVPSDKTPFWVRGGGTIHHAHHIGRTAATVHASGGTIADVLPA
jgi:hypothetical protein